MERPEEKDYFEFRGKTLIMDHGRAENYMDAQSDYIDHLKESHDREMLDFAQWIYEEVTQKSLSIEVAENYLKDYDQLNNK